ncbi:mCG1047442, partial [Mus musculus]
MSFGIVVTLFSLIHGLSSKQKQICFPYLLHSGFCGSCRLSSHPWPVTLQCSLCISYPRWLPQAT